jgi:hypothetical protein
VFADNDVHFWAAMFSNFDFFQDLLIASYDNQPEKSIVMFVTKKY